MTYYLHLIVKILTHILMQELLQPGKPLLEYLLQLQEQALQEPQEHL